MSPRHCTPTKGRVEVCTEDYGTDEGWLGPTRLYLDRRDEHIDAATVQMNDSYLRHDPRYDNKNARLHTIAMSLDSRSGSNIPTTPTTAPA